MLILMQALWAIVSAGLVALFFAGDTPPPPMGVYLVAALAGGAGGTWLYVRLRYGKLAVIRASRRID